MKQYRILKKGREETIDGIYDDQINYVFNELVRYRHFRSIVTGTNEAIIEISDVNGVCQSNNLIGK